MKVKKPRIQPAEFNQSRAALWTMQVAVGAVAGSIKRLTTLQNHVHRAHRAALGTFQRARHHPLKAQELRLVEECADELAWRLDWPAGFGVRTPRDHLERPLDDNESRKIGRFAKSAYLVTDGMLGLSETFDVWYGTQIVRAAEVARSAMAKVTVEEHKKRAWKLIDLLNQLCADDRVARLISVAARLRGIEARAAGGRKQRKRR